MALVALCRQRAVDPESIEAGLLYNDERIIGAGSVVRPSPQHSELGKKAGDIATGNNVARHLLTGSR